MAYCSFCGSRIEAGHNHCVNCGAQLDTRGYSSETDEPKVNPLLGLIGGLVGIVLAIVTTVISFALPVIVVMALIWGPSETWDRVTAWIPGVGTTVSEKCVGFDRWLDDAESELVSWEEDLSEFGAVTQMSTREVRQVIASTEKTIEWMESNEAPIEAKALSDEYLRMLNLTIEIYEAYLSGNRTELMMLRSQVMDVGESVMLERDRVITLCS